MYYVISLGSCTGLGLQSPGHIQLDTIATKDKCSDLLTDKVPEQD